MDKPKVIGTKHSLKKNIYIYKNKYIKYVIVLVDNKFLFIYFIF